MKMKEKNGILSWIDERQQKQKEKLGNYLVGPTSAILKLNT
jgi:hypothetical protein